jgi:hypothetical protein
MSDMDPAAVPGSDNLADAHAGPGEQRPSSGGSGSSSEHSKEGEGSKKEGEKQPKNCLTKVLCHKKKII